MIKNTIISFGREVDGERNVIIHIPVNSISYIKEYPTSGGSIPDAYDIHLVCGRVIKEKEGFKEFAKSLNEKLG